MTNRIQRESNIELLRIVSIFIIVVYHILIHSIIPNMPEYNYVTLPIITVLHIGVICFILISGYWGIKFTLKGFTKLFLYCSFYSILIYFVGCILSPDLFSLKASIKSVIPSQWWFIPVYLCLFLLIPIINEPFNTSNHKKKVLFLILLLIISFGFGQFIPSLSDGKNPINFVLVYYLGRYLRTELVVTKKVNIKKISLIYLICNIFIFSLIFISEINAPIISKIVVRIFFPYNSIGLIINSALFFLIFTQLNFHSRLINWLSTSALSVYLIHENQYIGPYIYDFANKISQQIDNPWILAISILLLASFVFTASILIDKIISPIFNTVIKRITETKTFIIIDEKLHQK